MKLLFWMAVGDLIGLAFAAHVVGGIVRDSVKGVAEQPRKRISSPRRRFLRKQARRANVS